jgi:hypothetical protein
MSKTFKDAPGSRQNRSGPGRGRGRQRNISVRAVRRDPPDLRKLSRALIQLAIAEAEAEAQDAGSGASDADAGRQPVDGDQRD